MHEDATEALLDFYKTNSKFDCGDFFHRCQLEKQSNNIIVDKEDLETREFQSLLQPLNTELSKALKPDGELLEQKYQSLKSRILIKSSQAKDAKDAKDAKETIFNIVC